MGKIAGKIEKVAKIIKSEGFPGFIVKLSKRIVYSMIHVIKELPILNSYFVPEKQRTKNLFTKKRIIPAPLMRDDNKGLESLFTNIKVEILNLRNKQEHENP
jgi:septum formation inhibitor-activating ATPase MinD